ncbi:terpenoid synthase [Lasiosphaeria hispida]|uniref:Terpene synthase n=1 Tax=Lasiosphaeria hispida TaxID=260671 RepID=A0AAJ0HAI1_9PEZI|nr:terpenoid synthase [Lasiosphaeria hispida]
MNLALSNMGIVLTTLAVWVRQRSPKETFQPTWIHIPDTLALWPWPRAINPYYEECKAESDAWIQSFNVFNPKAQAAFKRCEFALLAALGYPELNREGCHVGCDLMNLFFVFDEKSDISNEQETRYQANCIMDALRNPSRPRPPDEWVGGVIAQQFWQNGIKTVTPLCQKRFISSFQEYADAVVQQSADRDKRHIHSIDSYFPLRRKTIGSVPSFALIEMQFNIPNHVMSNPAIQQLTDLCTDMISIGNDMYSYNAEQSRGDEGHNLVTIAMNELGLCLQEAFDWIGRYHDHVATEFLSLYKHLPSFPDESEEVNKEVHAYVYGLGNWGGRYFGKDGLRILKERKVKLLQKTCLDTMGIFKQTPSSGRPAERLAANPSIV